VDAKEKARDRHYRKKYGISLEEYNQMSEERNHLCDVCKQPSGENALAVEHCHRWRYVKIMSAKRPSGSWVANAHYWGNFYADIADKKNEAIQEVRRQLQRASVRGLACFPCNRAIRAVRNRPDIAQGIADYLRRHQGGQDEK